MPLFGVPSQRRSTKVEKYTTPVATMVIAEEKKARSILFNEAAVTALGLPEDKAKIAFSFDGGIFVINGDSDPNIPEEVKINVTKLEPRKVSDKRTYEYIIKKLELDDQNENEFDLIPTSVDGMTLFELKLKTADSLVPDANVLGENVVVGDDDALGSDELVGESPTIKDDTFAPITETNPSSFDESLSNVTVN